MESLEAKEVVYLFRGTTRDWPGNPTAAAAQFTYTSLDPLVATLFAVECRSHGAAIVLVARRGHFEEIPPGPFDMTFQTLENQVVLATRPRGFAEAADFSLEVDRCLEILADLGFGSIAVRIRGKSHLRESLLESLRLGQRLNRVQIHSFISRAMGENR